MLKKKRRRGYICPARRWLLWWPLFLRYREARNAEQVKVVHSSPFPSSIQTKRKAKSAGGVVQVSSGSNVIFTFAGPGGWGHVPGAGGLLSSASGAGPRPRLAIILWGRRRCVRPILGGGGGLAADCLDTRAGLATAAETVLHLTDARFDVGELLIGLANVLSPVVGGGQVSSETREAAAARCVRCVSGTGVPVVDLLV